VKKQEISSLFDIADKNAKQDSYFHVFEALICLGKICVMDNAENRPEMVIVYTRLQNIMSSKIPDIGKYDLNYILLLFGARKRVEIIVFGSCI